MPPQSSSPTGRGESGWPGDPGQPGEPSQPGDRGQPGEPAPGEPGWPASDDWPDDDEPDPSWPDPADWPVAAQGAVRDGWRRRFLAVAAVAVVAAAAGAGIALIASPGPSASPAASASSGAAQSSPTPFTAPGQAGGSGGIPSGGLPSGAVARIILGGKVLAVSSTSITIDGGGHGVVAAVTSSTRFTGRARGIGSVKVGDMMVAEMTMSGSKVTAVTIQDPAAALPTGENAPGVS